MFILSLEIIPASRKPGKIWIVFPDQNVSKQLTLSAEASVAVAVTFPFAY